MKRRGLFALFPAFLLGAEQTEPSGEPIHVREHIKDGLLHRFSVLKRNDDSGREIGHMTPNQFILFLRRHPSRPVIWDDYREGGLDYENSPHKFDWSKA